MTLISIKAPPRTKCFFPSPYVPFDSTRIQVLSEMPFNNIKIKGDILGGKSYFPTLYTTSIHQVVYMLQINMFSNTNSILDNFSVSQVSSFEAVTRLQAGRPRYQSSIPGRIKTADDSPWSSTAVKNARSYALIPQHVFMAQCLIKDRDVLSFYRLFSLVQCEIGSIRAVGNHTVALPVHDSHNIENHFAAQNHEIWGFHVREDSYCDLLGYSFLS
jgi:hypothetical protein